MLDAALAYAAKGWHVHPLRPRAKTPLLEHGVHDATTDETLVREWWGRWPDANIGVACGSVSGLVVIDIDTPEAHEEWRSLLAEHGHLTTLLSRTGRGWQLFFGHPGGHVPCTASRIALGIDTRGDGGYVVVPPSIHPCGSQYVWVGDCDDPIPCPGWLLRLISPPPRARTQPTPATTAAPNRSYSATALEAEAAAVAGAPEGSRNDTLNRAAYNLGQLVAGGEIGHSDVVVRLTDAGLAAGLPEREVSSTLASGLRAGMDHPRSAPQRPSTHARADEYPNPPPPTDEDAPPDVEPEQPDREPPLVCAADITPRAVRWLWTGRIPRGKVTVLAGAPGVGKTTLALDVAARVSRGAAFPWDGTSPVQGAVLILSTEDDADDTLVPRLAAAEGDLDHIWLWPDDVMIPALPEDAARLAARLREWQVRLLVIDPLSCVMSAGLDSHKDAEVRRLFAPLRAVARDSDCAILGIAHLNKSPTGGALARIGGSVAWAAAARSVLLCTQDPDGDPDDMIVSAAKVSSARRPPAVCLRRTDRGGTVVLEWRSECEVSADELVEQTVGRSRGPAPEARQRAEEWLGRYLASGPQASAQAYEDAAAEGIARSTLTRARESLEVRVSRSRMDGAWYWSIPRSVAQ